ncbi:MAG: S9 family peptidase [Armatimonadetes bacterium]|nr:S9 family peptidase [Armatimonadota bacterium]
MQRTLKPQDLLQIKSVSDVQLSPDGKQIIVAVKSVRSPSQYQIHLYDWAGKKPKKLTKGPFSDTRPRFTKNGELYYLSNRKKDQPGIYRLGEGAVVLMPEGAIGNYALSPDGDKIAFLYRSVAESNTKQAKSDRKKNKESEPPLEVTRLPWKLDGDGEHNNQVFALYLHDQKKNSTEKILECDSGEILFVWSEDSKSIICAYDERTQPFMLPGESILSQIDLKGNETKRLPSPNGEIYALSLSPSGKNLALVYQANAPHKWGVRRQKFGIVELEHNKFKEFFDDKDMMFDGHALGDARDAAELTLLWTSESSLIAPWSERGAHRLVALDLYKEELLPLTTNEGDIYATAYRDGVAYGWQCSPSSPTEVVEITDTEIKERHVLNRDWLAEIELSTPVELPKEFNGWTLPAVGRAKKGPAIISVHGGPAGFYTAGFFLEMQLYAAQGWSVYFCNPRGSTSYGEDHARSILGEWGKKDWADIEALTQYAKAQPSTDPKRISIVGGSYGGFMVNWAISHSTEYYRAVSDRCVSNFLSKWGNSDYVMVPDGWWPGTVYGDITALWESSPIKHFANVKTPTLVVHSVGDLRCHVEQGEQVYSALKHLGVETKMIRYPATTSHGMSRNGPPDLRIHRLKAYLDWLK